MGKILEGRTLTPEEMRDLNRRMDEGLKEEERKKKLEWERKIHPSNFKCRLCGHTSCEAKVSYGGPIGPGGWADIEYYVCGGCSAIFTNPQKFSQVVKKVRKASSE